MQTPKTLLTEQDISLISPSFVLSEVFLLAIYLCIHSLFHSFSAGTGPFTTKSFFPEKGTTKFTLTAQGENSSSHSYSTHALTVLRLQKENQYNLMFVFIHSSLMEYLLGVFSIL